MDSLTVDALRQAFAVSVERYEQCLAEGRTKEWAKMEANSAVLARLAEAIEAHEARRTCEIRPGKDFRAEVHSAFYGAIAHLRTRKTLDWTWDWFWKRINAAVVPKTLF
jgi:hypothetical protein